MMDDDKLQTRKKDDGWEGEGKEGKNEAAQKGEGGKRGEGR